MESLTETVPLNTKTEDKIENQVADETTEEFVDEMQMSAQSLTGSEDDTKSENVETEPSITSVTELSNAEESNYAEMENVTKTKKSGFPGIPDLVGRSDWYKHKCFKRYWDHYNYVMSWCAKHKEMSNKLKERQKQNLQKKKGQRNQRTSCSYQYPWYYGANVYHPYFYGFPWQSDLQHSQGQSRVNDNKVTRSRRSKENNGPSVAEEDTEHTDKQSEVNT